MTREQTSSFPPPIPPTTEEDRFSWLRLLRSRRVGPSTFRRLMAEHHTAQSALLALPDVAQKAGVENYECCPAQVIEAELRAALACGARLLCTGEPDYPAALSEIDDAPPLLWTLGDRSLLGRPAIAMVGARNASSLGTRMARALSKDLGEHGQVIVSGLARGIDAAAHHAALETGTIAVLAGGVDICYPAENTALQEKIAQQGLCLSEQPMGLRPFAKHFPRRNRIISGLARAVVIVEAAAKSGSLITARDALDQGRDVQAVPGHPFDARAAGCNLLIRDGALLVRNAHDVLSALPQPQDHDAVVAPSVPAPDSPRSNKRTLKDTAALHSQILSRLGPSPLGEDQLIRDLNRSAGDVGTALTDLELDGKISRHPGGLLSLNH